jgi:hypothetical protein
VNHLTFSRNLIEFIPTNILSLHLKEESNETIKICVDNLPLNSSSFKLNAFDNMKRPTILEIWKDAVDKNDKFTFLDEKVFYSFLNANSKNRINLMNRQLDCDNCLNYWLKEYDKYIERIMYLSCFNGRSFNDFKNFLSCSNYF